MAKTSPKKVIAIADLKSAIHDAFNSYEVEVYNGGDKLIKKPFGVAFTANSQDLRDIRNDLKKNTTKTEEITDLVSGIKERRDALDSFTTPIKRVIFAFRIPLALKIIGAIIGLYAAFHLSKDIPEFLTNTLKWLNSL